jgi:hypothetical protein
MDQTAHVRQRGLIAERPSAAGIGPRGDVPSHSVPSESLLDKGQTDAKQGGNSVLGAKPLITGAQNLLSEVKGVSFHAREHNSLLPYVQLRTAIVDSIP